MAERARLMPERIVNPNNPPPPEITRRAWEAAQTLNRYTRRAARGVTNATISAATAAGTGTVRAGRAIGTGATVAGTAIGTRAVTAGRAINRYTRTAGRGIRNTTIAASKGVAGIPEYVGEKISSTFSPNVPPPAAPTPPESKPVPLTTNLESPVMLHKENVSELLQAFNNIYSQPLTTELPNIPTIPRSSRRLTRKTRRN